MEGCFYDYVLSHPEYYLKDPFDNIVQPHKSVNYVGRIAPNIYVGTLEIPLYKKHNPNPVGTITLEVQSVKSTYRDDYRHMLEFITEKCTDLLLQANSPCISILKLTTQKTVKPSIRNLPLSSRLLALKSFLRPY